MTHAELEDVISGPSGNSNHASPLTQRAESDYSPSQMQEVLNKLDELIDALRR